MDALQIWQQYSMSVIIPKLKSNVYIPKLKVKPKYIQNKNVHPTQTSSDVHIP